MTSVRVLALVLLVSASPRPAAAVDLSGTYVTVLQLLQLPCSLTFNQSGTTLTINGPCTLGSTSYTFDLTGTVDVGTGAFATTGALLGLCGTQGQVTLSGSGDGETFTGTTSCNGAASFIAGTKCNNGMLDASEDCEDGNTSAGDCCSPTCQFEAPGAACASDANACTPDVCDGAGQCQHLIEPGAAGQPCTSDLNQCTDDVCNAAGLCTHPPNTETCDDNNACTTADVCASGTCVGGPIAPECSGTIDLTGEWELSRAFLTGTVRVFTQTGAVLESTNPSFGIAGIGTINPATGAFVAMTPYSVLFVSSCLEVIVGTATADAQELTGSVTTYCGLDGTFGPYAVSGRRLDPVVGGACTASAACASSTASTRLAVSSNINGAHMRWRWDAQATYGNLGDPTISDDYRVCMETPQGGFVEIALHGSKWRKTDAGFRYSDPTGPVRRLWVKSESLGAFLPWNVSFAMSLAPSTTPTLPLTAPVRVRFVRTGSAVCFESVFANPSSNTTRRFRARD